MRTHIFLDGYLDIKEAEETLEIFRDRDIINFSVYGTPITPEMLESAIAYVKGIFSYPLDCPVCGQFIENKKEGCLNCYKNGRESNPEHIFYPFNPGYVKCPKLDNFIYGPCDCIKVDNFIVPASIREWFFEPLRKIYGEN